MHAKSLAQGRAHNKRIAMTALLKWLVEKPLLYGGSVLIWHLDQEGKSFCLLQNRPETQEYAKVPEKSVSLETSTTVNPWGYFPIFLYTLIGSVLDFYSFSRRKRAIVRATSVSL